MSTTAATRKPEPDRLEKLFVDLEGKYQKPDPENIALGTQRFERILTSIIVPFLGLNAFLISGLVLHNLYPNQLLAPLGSNTLAALAIAAWMYFRREQSDRFPVLFFSAVPTFLIAAFLAIPNFILGFALVLIVTYVFAGLVCKKRIEQTAVPLFVLYLPILLWNLQTNQTWRIALEFLTLIPLGIAFVSRRLRVATSAVVVSAVITASLENSSDPGITALVILLFLLVAVGIWYEVRIPKSDYSPLRAILDQGLLVLLAYLALHAVGFKSEDRLTWTWAAVVTVYEVIQCWREKLSFPTRIGVAGISVAIALWATNKPIPASIPIGGTMLIVAVINLVALHLGASLLANLSFFLLIPGAVKIYELSIGSLSATAATQGLIMTMTALLVSRKPLFASPRPWWNGFIKANHLAWAKNMLLMVAGTLLRFSLAAFVFNIFRSCMLWLRYFKGKRGRFGLNDVFYAAAHFYGAMILSRQMQLLAASRNASSNTQLTFATTVWVLWGLAIFGVGIQRHTLYQRFLGLGIVAAPLVLYFPAIQETDAAGALVSIVIGGAFWIVGVLKQIPSREVGDAQQGSEEL